MLGKRGFLAVRKECSAAWKLFLWPGPMMRLPRNAGRKLAPSKPSCRASTAQRERQGSIVQSLPHIAKLIDCGGIAVGGMNPACCIAVVSTGHGCLAMLRRQGETLARLFTLLSWAVAKALGEDGFSDEINARH